LIAPPQISFQSLKFRGVFFLFPALTRFLIYIFSFSRAFILQEAFAQLHEVIPDFRGLQVATYRAPNNRYSWQMIS
jgi:hypothetical protein